ncbi:MAG: OmpA family protein [Pseudomonadota bacterium]
MAALALITLFALLPFASLWIEDNAEQAALTSLRSGGEGWADVSASGQWITLTGEAPSPDRAANAITLVRSVAAPTLFGRARPVTRVIDRTTVVGASDGLEPESRATEDPEMTRTATPEQARIDACDRSLRALLQDSKIEFSVASAQIAPASADLLDQLADAVTECGMQVTIEGHTDSTGSATLNDSLSLARAQSVRTGLIARGVSEDLLTAEGYGAARPIAENDTPEGREQNRRIEFNVHSNDEAQE